MDWIGKGIGCGPIATRGFIWVRPSSAVTKCVNLTAVQAATWNECESLVPPGQMPTSQKLLWGSTCWHSWEWTTGLNEHRDRTPFLPLLLFLAGPGGWGAANRLDYSYDDFLDIVQEEQLQTPLSGSVKTAPSRVKRHKKLNIPMTDHKIKLIFNITGEEKLPLPVPPF